MQRSEKVPAGEFLVYTGDDGAARIQVRLAEGTLWLSQRVMAELYGRDVRTINEHLQGLFAGGELEPAATIRKFRIIATEGRRQVSRLIDHYSLPAILAVGHHVRSPRGSSFRQWATARLDEYLVKGFVVDDERLKAGTPVGDDYFAALIERIRDIRGSERRFYQKITDLFAHCSVDYDPQSPFTAAFYANVQNKLHWAIHGHTAAELIQQRADASQPHMGLTNWKGSPEAPIRKTDIAVAKNYLTEEEIRELGRIVTMYLDYAEDQARRRRPMTMQQWAAKLDGFLAFNEREVLDRASEISHELAVEHARGEFDRYAAERRRSEVSEGASDFDRAVEAAQRGEEERERAGGERV